MIHLWAAFLFSCFYSYHWNGSVLILSIHVCRTKQIHKCKCHKASIKAYSELPRYKESVKNKKPTQASKLADIAYFHLCQKENRPRLSPGRFTYKREIVCRTQSTSQVHTLTFSSELKVMGFSHSAKVVIISEKAAAFY